MLSTELTWIGVRILRSFPSSLTISGFFSILFTSFSLFFSTRGRTKNKSAESTIFSSPSSSINPLILTVWTIPVLWTFPNITKLPSASVLSAPIIFLLSAKISILASLETLPADMIFPNSSTRKISTNTLSTCYEAPLFSCLEGSFCFDSSEVPSADSIVSSVKTIFSAAFSS